MSLWWLSFVDPNRPRGRRGIGVVLVEADSFQDAMQRAWVTGCNPGGEVEGHEMPIDRMPNERRVRLARAPRNTLLDREALEDLDLI